MVIIIFGIILCSAFGKSPKERDRRLLMAVAMLCYPVVSDSALHLLSLRPQVIDPQLYRMDVFLGLDTFALARFVSGIRWLDVTLQFAYDFLCYAVALVFLSTDRPEEFMRACVASALGSIVCYILIPAAGPAFACTSFPYPGTCASVLPAGIWRNACPSMHVTWAVLVAYYSPKRLQLLGAVFLALTVVSTLSTGQHYAVDVLAAIPWSWLAVGFVEGHGLPWGAMRVRSSPTSLASPYPEAAQILCRN